MLSNPHQGEHVQLWYARRYCAHMPLHGRVGHVVIVGRGRPRNHGVMVDGRLVCVPCGNVRRAKG